MVKLLNNKVSSGKINHKNAKKISCQIVLFSSKKALVVPLLSTAKLAKLIKLCFRSQIAVNGMRGSKSLDSMYLTFPYRGFKKLHTGVLRTSLQTGHKQV